jgi:hypothetical protein
MAKKRSACFGSFDEGDETCYSKQEGYCPAADDCKIAQKHCGGKPWSQLNDDQRSKVENKIAGEQEAPPPVREAKRGRPAEESEKPDSDGTDDLEAALANELDGLDSKADGKPEKEEAKEESKEDADLPKKRGRKPKVTAEALENATERIEEAIPAPAAVKAAVAKAAPVKYDFNFNLFADKLPSLKNSCVNFIIPAAIYNQVNIAVADGIIEFIFVTANGTRAKLAMLTGNDSVIINGTVSNGAFSPAESVIVLEQGNLPLINETILAAALSVNSDLVEEVVTRKPRVKTDEEVEPLAKKEKKAGRPAKADKPAKKGKRGRPPKK